jgi:hypothetical protein
MSVEMCFYLRDKETKRSTQTDSPVGEDLSRHCADHSVPPRLEGRVHVHIGGVVSEALSCGGVEGGRSAIHSVVHHSGARGALEEDAEGGGREVALWEKEDMRERKREGGRGELVSGAS